MNHHLTEGSTVAVFGCGAIGLGVIAKCAIIGASRIIAIDTNPRKDAWAKKFQATEFLNPSNVPEGKKSRNTS
jgi:S-(hydroxymethyl)glutathione dehydrogenase/alcohol dehydrogenase